MIILKTKHMYTLEHLTFIYVHLIGGGGGGGGGQEFTSHHCSCDLFHLCLYMYVVIAVKAFHSCTVCLNCSIFYLHVTY